MPPRPRPGLTPAQIHATQADTELFTNLLTLFCGLLSLGPSTIILLYGDTLLHTIPLAIITFLGGFGVCRSILKLREGYGTARER